MNLHINICKQKVPSMRCFFHVELPGSSFLPFLQPRAHCYESFPAFMYFFVFFLYDAIFQLTGFVRLWLCYKSQFRGVLQLKLVLL